MKIGIIGPPQSGKTTIFKILLQADASGTIGVSRAIDYRVEKISEAFLSKKKTYPEFTFVDLGPVASFAKKDLSKLQDVDLFICAVGAMFTQDPKKDFEKCLTDIIISDLEVAQNRTSRIEKEKKSDAREKEVLEKSQAFLSDGKFLSKAGLDKDEVKLISGLVLLSLKPLIVAINIQDQDAQASGDKIKLLEEYCASRDLRYIRFFGKTELELLELGPEEKEKFLKEIGPGYNFREDVAKLICKELNLVTFFTTGEKETRGWYLRKGLNALEAAGKVHSDMKRGFIRAEVVNFEDFVKCGSMHKAREEGLLKVEGKEYVVKDGDIINIRFNV